MSKQGWGIVEESKKRHYFDEGGRSICGSWLFFGKMEDDGVCREDNCKTCEKKLAKRHARKSK